MRQMTEKEFHGLTKKGNLVPVYKEIYGDLETPVSAYMKLARGRKYSFLLESVEGAEKLARYSFIANSPELVVRSKGRDAEILRFNKTAVLRERRGFDKNPLEIVREIMSSYQFVDLPGLPIFCGGFVGYLGYDIVRFLERLPETTPDDLDLPDMVLMLSKDLVIFDHLHHTIKLVSCVHLEVDDKREAKGRKYRAAMRRIAVMEKAISGPLPSTGRVQDAAYKLKGRSTCSQKQFEQMVEQAKEDIRAGEIIQVVLSQRFEVDVKTDAITVYRTLRALNPSPYMFLLNLDKFELVGSSPELLVRCENGVVATRPIAGTRPRGRNEEEDLQFEKDLLADPKERAEHVMLVDLGRNDLGRVCEKGTVTVTDLMSVERYSHVMHIVSNVQGCLRDEYDPIAALEATFPAGTLSGAPKVRAMEIIEKLEKTRRGPYGGCVGYFSFSQNLDTCITIRTIIIKGAKAFIQAGAGIVADSDPSVEYQETVNKAGAQMKALKMAHLR